jgi:hypothetical protein
MLWYMPLRQKHVAVLDVCCVHGRATSTQPRDSRSRQVVVRVDSVRPAPALQPEVEELRLKVGPWGEQEGARVGELQ